MLLTCFFVVCFIGIIHHEMWYDEIVAWMIARDSNSLYELFKNTEYSGHPILWYLGLYIINRFTNSPVAMQIFHLVIATGVICVFLWFSPFNKIQKTLFCFGYFPLFEYGIISRNYSLGILLIFIFCAYFSSRHRNYIFLAVILALLSLTNIFGLVFSLSFIGLLIIDAVTDQQQVRYLFARRWNIATGAIIYCFGLISSIIQIIPPATSPYQGDLIEHIEQNIDLSDNTTSNLEYIASYIRELEKLFTSVWRSYVPIPNFSADKIWGTNWLTDSHLLPEILTFHLGSILGVILSLLLLIFFSFSLIQRRKILFLYLGTSSLMFVVFFFGRVPRIRHSGHLFILLIVCFWLAEYFPKFNISPRLKGSSLINAIAKYQKQVFTIVLCLNLMAGISLYFLDLTRPFSPSKNVADYIEENNLNNLTIVGSEDTWISPLSALLDKQIYYPEISDFGTFVILNYQWKSRVDNPKQEDILQQVARLIKQGEKKILLILNKELEKQFAELEITPLIFFETSMVPKEEQYYLYLVKKTSK